MLSLPIINYQVSISYTNVLDFLGALFAFIATIYYVRAHSWAWSISLLAIAINIFLYWKQGIYADTVLQLVYVAMAIYGWWQWLHPSQLSFMFYCRRSLQSLCRQKRFPIIRSIVSYSKPSCLDLASQQPKKPFVLPVTHISFKAASSLLVLFLLSAAVGSLILRFYTDSHVPYWDATTTVLSLLGQWLMCRKVIETWIVWFVVDALFAGLYVYKGIPVHALLQLIYLGMAITGYLNWARKLKKVSVSDVLVEELS